MLNESMKPETLFLFFILTHIETENLDWSKY